MPRDEIFRQTGIQFMRFNTLFQLLAMQRDRSPLLDAAETLLFMPDLFHYFFTGIKVNEYTDASTSQMLDPHTRGWAVRSGAGASGCRGKSSARSCSRARCSARCGRRSSSETGINAVPVIAPATHDTAAAVAAVPASGDVVGLHQLRHLVADGRGAAAAARQRSGAGRPTSPTRAASAARRAC